MVETIGSQLRRVRTSRGLSLDDAAHATKIRPARLADLERDVYTNFPNIAYARGFLAIYGRFLGVDVSPYLGAFEDTNSFGLDDYQYLRDEPIAEFRAPRRETENGAVRRRSLRPHHRRPKAAGASARFRRVPLVLGGLALSFGLVAVTAWYLTLRLQQLGSLEQLAARQDARNLPAAAVTTASDGSSAAPAAQRPAPPPAGTPSPVLSSLPIADPPGLEEFAGTSLSSSLLAVSLPLLAPSPAAAPLETPPPVVVATAAPKPAARPAKEVSVRPLKRTYLTVVVNDPAAQPAYANWLGPNTHPLSFYGDRIFVHVRDKNSVEVRKNGVIQPLAGTDIAVE